MIWTTSNRIYTHSEKYGIIKGQVWSPKAVGTSGEVVGITVNGRVILDHSPKLIPSADLQVHVFLERYKLTEPVFLKAHIQHNVTRIQTFRLIDGRMVARGTLKENYVWPKCNCKCHYDDVLHITGCCDGTYKKYPVFDQSKR